MFKFLPAFLTAMALLISPAVLPKPAMAGPKYVGTGKTIKPGQPISLQVTNHTSETVQVELPSYVGPITMKPKQKLKLNVRLRQQDRGVSFLYWTPKGEVPLQAKVAKPNARTLQVQLSRSRFYRDDRALYDSEFNDTIFVF